MKRKVAHNEQERQEFIALDYKEVGKEENGNYVFWSNKIEDLLSHRELQVYKLKAKSNEYISKELSISVESVENYRVKIESKL